MNARNAGQIEMWNGLVGQKWARLQDKTDLMLNNITDHLMPFACAKPGERALDIGCGCGSTTFRLAMSVQPNGSVAGVDISAPMLDVARARSQAMNADIPFLLEDASSYDFQPVFDLVFSRFGVMFFDDPVAAFKNIRTALAPNGRLAFVCWRDFKENPWAFAPYIAAKPFLPEQPQTDPTAPGPFAFADADRLRKILSDAGFNDIRIEKLDTTSSMGANADEAADESLNIGPLSRAANELPEETRQKIRAVAKEALAKFQTPAGIAPPAACWLVGATL
ncbi:MAG TPA: class I SAM-dependent methyltransferase [Rhizomicrobium sp.]|jgi:SAM-dependent methyltransferase